MFERYTGKARRVVFFARYEASQYGSPYIETEHLLLGLLREEGVLSRRFLPSPCSAEAIRKRIDASTTIREKVATSVDLPLSSESNRVLAYATEEAERLSDTLIGGEHLLLGLLREQGCRAAVILREIGVDFERARVTVSSLVRESSSPAESTASFIRAKGVGSIEFRCEGELIATVAVHVLSPTPRIGEKVAFKNKEGEHLDYRVEDVKYIYENQLADAQITPLLSKVVVVMVRERND